MCLFIASAPIHADETADTQQNLQPPKFPWYDNLFLEASVIYYFVPEMLEEYLESKPGFRIALGYEYKQFRFALESGYSHIGGTNPLVSEISFVPLVFKFGYFFPVYSIFSLQADIGLGAAFSKTTRYKDAIDILMDNHRTDEEKSFFSGLRLYAAVTPLSFLKIYGGGGIDVIFEREGAIPLVLIELGVSIKPVPVSSKINEYIAKKKETEVKRTVFSSRKENIIVEETAEGKVVRLLNAVYFEANTAVMIERYRPILNEAGERLRANPALKITLRGYTAPFGTAKERAEVSALRARYCADYLSKQYGINESRMTLESYGAQRSPEFKDANWESYRCVELIINE